MVSAVYDRALDASEITRDDIHSLLKEHIILEETNRRKMFDTLSTRAMAMSGLPISSKDKFDSLKSVLDITYNLQFPWVESNSSKEESEYPDYIQNLVDNFEEIVKEASEA